MRAQRKEKKKRIKRKKNSTPIYTNSTAEKMQ